MGPGRQKKAVMGAESTQGLIACWLSSFCCGEWANTRAAAATITCLVLADELQELEYAFAERRRSSLILNETVQTADTVLQSKLQVKQQPVRYEGTCVRV
jgi:hypothetical protein